jgi:hemoglobin
MLRCGKGRLPRVQSRFVGKPGSRGMQEQTLYLLLGGETTVARLCDRFYELMAQVPQFATIRALHPDDLQSSRDKLFMFLSGWLGGPDLYVQQIGHPMLRRRHMPFAIGEEERDQWVACMLLAMESTGIEESLREKLLAAFFNTADFMRNQPGPVQR